MTKPTDAAPLNVERVARADYIGRNARGAEVRIGNLDSPGAFAPGELLALAVGACGLLSADHTLAGRLGEDYAAHVAITATKDADGTRYESITAELITSLAALDPDKRATLIERAERAIEHLCTVSHTLAHGAHAEVRIRHQEAS